MRESKIERYLSHRYVGIQRMRDTRICGIMLELVIYGIGHILVKSAGIFWLTREL